MIPLIAELDSLREMRKEHPEGKRVTLRGGLAKKGVDYLLWLSDPSPITLDWFQSLGIMDQADSGDYANFHLKTSVIHPRNETLMEVSIELADGSLYIDSKYIAGAIHKYTTKGEVRQLLLGLKIETKEKFE